MRRAVAATWSPRSRAAIATSRPKPRDVPVMNQVFTAINILPFFTKAGDSPRGLFRACRLLSPWTRIPVTHQRSRASRETVIAASGIPKPMLAAAPELLLAGSRIGRLR
jgi:hypothetical protein